jgi:hypothetical protein
MGGWTRVESRVCKNTVQCNEDHPVYTRDSYNYTQPFPNFRFMYKINDNNKLSAFTTEG